MKTAAVTPAIAFGRSCGVKSTGSTDSDSGRMAAAPSPSTARAAISAPAEPEYAQAIDATPNSASDASSTFLRPYLSPISPAGSSTAASTSVYALMNHCRSLVEACRSVASVGNARLSTVRSSPTTSTARASATSAPHLRVPDAIVTLTTFQLFLLRECNYNLIVTVNIEEQPVFSGSGWRRPLWRSGRRAGDQVGAWSGWRAVGRARGPAGARSGWRAVRLARGPVRHDLVIDSHRAGSDCWHGRRVTRQLPT